MSKSLFFQLVVLVLVLYCSPISANPKKPRIVGGTATTISNLKYLVYLRISGEFSCGGTLVSSRHVVTAAHCVKGERARTLVVVGGATYLSQGGVRRRVSRVILPKAYNANTLHFDVAVLKLSRAMTGTNISPIGLCSSSWSAGNTITVSGWGTTSASSSGVSNQVRTVNVPLISKSTCSSKYSGEETLTKTMFCASDGSRDACTGDSGGPAVYGGRLCGITSWGIGCASSQYPGVYTNVKMVRKFIIKALKI